LTHDFKEMHRYQIIKLSDLIDLANSQISNGQNCFYKHFSEKEPMEIDGWMLFSLKNSGNSKLIQFL